MLRILDAAIDLISKDEEKENNVKGEILLKSSNMVEWKVPDFFSIPGEIGQHFESPSFPYLDGTWCLQCYPKGGLSRSVFLGLMRIKSTSNHTLTYQLGIKREDGLEYVLRADKFDFLKDGEIGELRLVQRTFLLDDKKIVARRDEITFFCILPTGNKKDAESQTVGSKGTNKITENLMDIFHSGDHSDTIIKVQDQEFRVHKFILIVRSPVFRSMFKHDTAKHKNVITIENCSPGAFGEFLSFLYSGELKDMSLEHVTDVYVVADKYQVAEVKSECVKFMIREMSKEKFCDFISLALKHSETDLLDRSTKYFVKNAKSIIVTVKWQCFQKEYPTESNVLYFRALSCMHQE